MQAMSPHGFHNAERSPRQAGRTEPRLTQSCQARTSYDELRSENTGFPVLCFCSRFSNTAHHMAEAAVNIGDFGAYASCQVAE